MRVIGTIRSTSTEQVVVDDDSYEQARQRLVEQVPDGYELISIRVDREVAAG